MNQELLSYIETSRASGLSDENIKSALRHAGWGDDVITSAFAVLPTIPSVNFINLSPLLGKKQYKTLCHHQQLHRVITIQDLSKIPNDSAPNIF